MVVVLSPPPRPGFSGGRAAKGTPRERGPAFAVPPPPKKTRLFADGEGPFFRRPPQTRRGSRMGSILPTQARPSLIASSAL